MATGPEPVEQERVAQCHGPQRGSAGLEFRQCEAFDRKRRRTTFHRSYRGATFERAKARNREQVQAAADAGRLHLRLQSNVLKIEPDAVVLDCAGNADRVTNDAVIISAGGVLPAAFLQSLGIVVETKHGTA